MNKETKDQEIQTKVTRKMNRHQNTRGGVTGRGSGRGRCGRGGGKPSSLMNKNNENRANNKTQGTHNVITGEVIEDKSSDRRKDSYNNNKRTSIKEDDSYKRLTPLKPTRRNDEKLSAERTKERNKSIVLRSRIHDKIDAKEDSKMQTIFPGTEGWYNINILNEEIMKLKKRIATPNPEMNQNQILDDIQIYEERYNELIDLQLLEDRTDNENIEAPTDEVEIPLWEDVVHINNEIKKYELQAHQQRHLSKEATQPLHAYILELRARLNDLMTEETLHNIEHPEFCPQPDYQMIKEVSDVAFYHSSEWDDLSFVNRTILGLKLEQTKESDEKQRKEIEVIEDLFQRQKKTLIESRVSHDEQLIKEGKITFNNNTGEVKIVEECEENMEVNSTGESPNIVDNIQVTSNEHLVTQTEDVDMSETGIEDETIHSKDTKSLADSAKAINTQNSTSTEKRKENSNTQLSASSLRKNIPMNTNYGTTSVDNSNTTESAKLSYSQATRGNSNKESEPNHIDGSNSVRIRFQFKANDIPVGKTFAEQIKQKLHDIMLCSKEIDQNNKLLPWKENSGSIPLHGKEILLLGNDTIKEYVASPKNLECLTRDKMYYHFGLRIKTVKSVHTFTEQWNNNKYNLTAKYPILKWVAMRPSEMQTSSSAYAVGYFIGSSERGEYKTLNNELKSIITKPRIEASFQTISQDKVSSAIWGKANAKAEAEGVPPKSKQSRTIKYKYSPSALVVYVDKREHMKEARRVLYDKYGTLEENNSWPTMPDGSKMLFTPILRGDLSDELVDDLTEAMAIQVALKADEVLMDIKIQIIHDEKQYFNNQSLEHIIHQATIKIDDATELPIFKHICRKWMIDASNVKYQVAVQQQMVERAGKYIQGLKATLINEYGQEAGIHFEEKVIQKQFNMGAKKNEGNVVRLNNEDEDPEMEIRIVNNKGGGIYGKVMLTGMHLLHLNEANKEEEDPKAMLIHTGNSDESMSGVTSTSRSTQGNIKWDDEIEGKERTCEVVQSKSKEKIINSCVKYDIKYQEVQRWVNENVVDLNDPIHKWTYQDMQKNIPYDQWKSIIVDIKNKRRQIHKTNSNINDEFNDPEIDAAISTIPSAELIPPTQYSPLKASPLKNEALPHNPYNKTNKERNVGSQRQ